MRRDIGYNVALDDLILRQDFSAPRADNAVWAIISSQLVLQVYVSENITDDMLNDTGVLVNIPYYDDDNTEFRVSFYRYDSTQGRYVICYPAGGGASVPADASLYGASKTRVKTWETRIINVLGDCLLIAKSGRAHIGAAITDLELRNVDNQDAYLLLKSEPGAMLRYPLSGVGIIKWTNSPGNANELYDAIRREMQNDGLTIQNMFYTPEQGLTLRVTSDGNI
jgi:hypothetical protein